MQRDPVDCMLCGEQPIGRKYIPVKQKLIPFIEHFSLRFIIIKEPIKKKSFK